MFVFVIMLALVSPRGIRGSSGICTAIMKNSYGSVFFHVGFLGPPEGICGSSGAPHVLVLLRLIVMRTHSCCMGSSGYPKALADPVARRTVLNPWEPRQVFIPSLHAWLCVYVFLYTDSAAVYQIEKEEGERERERERKRT